MLVCERARSLLGPLGHGVVVGGLQHSEGAEVLVTSADLPAPGQLPSGFHKPTPLAKSRADPSHFAKNAYILLK